MFKKYQNLYSLDDPRTTLERQQILHKNQFLRSLYQVWYQILKQSTNNLPNGILLEIGSGGGFLKEIIPDVITSDIMELPGVDRQFNAEKLPFPANSLAAILMINVFHHITRPTLFLQSAQTCLVTGGKIVMIEPANSWLASWVYKNFHHEEFDPSAGREIPAGGPLSVSNQALPYIYFERDLEQFKLEFPNLRINYVKYHTPLLYILSGGFSRSAFLPAGSFKVLQIVEKLLSPLNQYIGLFCTIEIEKLS